jgi:DNA-binding response OmpR family regulator
MESKILIVSDEHDTKELYIDTLESQGYHVISITSGKKAIAEIQKHRPDVVLLGIMISDMDGLHVLECIRSNPAICHTKVIMLSAIKDEATIKRAYDLGADDYLIRKEVPLIDLLKKVDKAISRVRV